MATLDKPTLPLDPLIQDAWEDARRPEKLTAMMRQAVREIVYEDLKEELRKLLNEHGS